MPSDLDFTTVVAADATYLPVLKTAYKSWVANRPEMLLHPMLVLIDKPLLPEVENIRAFLNHPSVEFVAVADLPGADQRERMLTAFVKCAELVKTRWLLKVDVDVLATSYVPGWCSQDLANVCCGQTEEPAIIAPAWAYTKPANAVQVLDDWADARSTDWCNMSGLWSGERSHGGLIAVPRLNLTPAPGSDKVMTPGRFTSYVMFGQTEWLKWAASLCPGRLPVPSQDTYHWYLCRRTETRYAYLPKHLGWSHVRPRKMEEAMQAHVVPSLMPRDFHAHRGVLKELLAPLNPRVGVEIGVFKGETSAALLDAFPDLILHMVDPWAEFAADSAYAKSGDGKAKQSETVHRANQVEAIRRTAFAWPRTRMLKMTSLEAAKDTPDGVLDFVFVDGDHTYEGCKADLETWWPKLRSGAILCGHDYAHLRERRRGGLFGVKRAADEFAAKVGKALKVHGEKVFSMVK